VPDRPSACSDRCARPPIRRLPARVPREPSAIFAQANIAIGTVTYEATRRRRSSRPAWPASAPASCSRTAATTAASRCSSCARCRRPASRSWSAAPRARRSPAPAPRAIAIALCNNTDLVPPRRAWLGYLARITAHAMAATSGSTATASPARDYAVDPLVDSPTSDDNLMYWGEMGHRAVDRAARDPARQPGAAVRLRPARDDPRSSARWRSAGRDGARRPRRRPGPHPARADPVGFDYLPSRASPRAGPGRRPVAAAGRAIATNDPAPTVGMRAAGLPRARPVPADIARAALTSAVVAFRDSDDPSSAST
jgi:hypothetical protein